jgi:hypothetical protein
MFENALDPVVWIIAAVLLAGILGLTGIAVIDLTIALQRFIRKTSSLDKVGNNLRARKPSGMGYFRNGLSRMAWKFLPGTR